MSYPRARYAVYFSDLKNSFDTLHCRVPTLAIGRKVASRLNRELIEKIGGEAKGLPLYYAALAMRTDNEDDNEGAGS